MRREGAGESRFIERGVSALALAILLLVAAAGCGATAPVSAPMRREPGTTVMRLDNHLGWPFELERVALLVDGRPVGSRTGVLSETTWLEPLPLSPGWHLLVLRVVAGYASDMAGSRCTVELRTLRVFAVAEQPATITLDLHLRGVTHHFSQRPTVAVRLRGARAIDLDVLRDARRAEQRCAKREATEALLCRAEMRTARAERNRNAYAHECFVAKLEAMRALADVRRRWLERMKAEPEAEAPAGSPAAMVLLAERRMQTVWREFEQCAPYDRVVLRESTRSVSGRGCESDAPIEPAQAE